jgi:toxin HigB-1
MQIRIDDETIAKIHEDSRYRFRAFDKALHRAIRKVLALIEEVPGQRDLYQFKSLRLEKLRGDRAGQSSMRLNEQFRLIVRFETLADGQVCVVVEVVDYH